MANEMIVIRIVYYLGLLLVSVLMFEFNKLNTKEVFKNIRLIFSRIESLFCYIFTDTNEKGYRTVASEIAKKALIFVSLLFILFASNSLDVMSQVKTYKVAAFNFYPGIFRNDIDHNQIQGFYVETLNEIAKLEGVKFEYVYGSWAEGIDRLKKGEVDLLTSVAFTEERAKFMDYGKEVLLTVWSELYVPVESELDAITDLNNKTIALMTNDFNAQNFKNLVSRFGITCNYLYLPDFAAVFEATKSGKADAGVVNSTFGVPKYKDYSLRSTGVVFNPFDLYFTVLKGYNSELLNILDEYLNKWKHTTNSVYNKSRQKWAHGNIGKIQVFPNWLTSALIIMLMFLIIGTVFIVLLRFKVRQKTYDLVVNEKQLAAINENLYVTLNSIGDGVISTDINGNVTQMNPIAEKMCGYKLEEAKGKPLVEVFNIVNAETRQEVVNPVAKVIQSGQIIGLANHTVLISKDGTEYQISDSAAPIKNKDGDIYGVVLVFSDVTMQYNMIKALRDSEERFQMLFQQAPLGYQSLDFDGNFIDVNQQWLNTMGYERNEVIGKWFGDFLIPEAKSAFRERFPLFKAAGSIHSEFPMIRKDGAEIFVAFEGKIGYDVSGEFKQTHCILQDITEKVKAEIALKESEQRYKTLANTGLALVWTSGLDKGCDYFNDIWLNFTGRTFEQEFGNGWAEGVHPEDFDMCLNIYVTAFDKREQFSMVYRMKRYDGEYRYILDQGSPRYNSKDEFLGFIGHCFDITERINAEEEAKEQAALIDSLFNHIPDMIFYKDNEFKYVDCNPAFAEFIGKPKEDIIGHNDFEFFDKEHAEQFRYHDKIIIESQKANKNEEIVVYPDGRNVYLETLKTPFIDDNGKLIGLLGISRDITERKQNEQQILEHRRSLIQAQAIAKFGSWELDHSTYIIKWSDEVYRIFGQDKNLFLPTLDNSLNQVPDDEREIVQSAFISSVTNKTKHNITHKIVLPNGLIKCVVENCEHIYDADGKVIRSIGTVQDITEIKQKEIELEIANTRWKTTFDAITNPIALLDQNGLIIQVNSAYSEFINTEDPEALIGQHCYRIVHKTEDHIDNCPFLRAKESKLRESMLLNVNTAIFKVSIDPVMNANNQFLGAVHILEDITEQINREEAILETNEYLENIINYANSPIIVWDNELRITQFNSAFEKISGYNTEFVMGKNVSILFPEIEIENSIELINQTTSGDRWEGVEIKIKHSSGEIKTLLWSSANVFDSKSKKIIATIAQGYDISDKIVIEKTQQFLLRTAFGKESEEFFRALAKYLSITLDMDYICIDELSADTLSAETLAIYFDGNFEDNVRYTLYDTPCGDVVGKEICKFVSGVRHKFPKDQVLQDMLAESYIGATLKDSEGKSIGLIAAIGRKNLHNEYLAESVMQLVSIRAAAELERMKAENALQDSEAKFRGYIENAPDIILMSDAEGNFLDLNYTAEQCFGYSREEFLSMHASQSVADIDYDKAVESFRILAIDGVYQDELLFKRKDGSTFYGLLSARVLASGRVLGFIKNIDEIKRIQYELQVEKERAEESDRLKSAFLANMSHEIRTPMNGIIGYSMIMTEPNLSDEERIEYASILNASCYRLLNTVNDVLEISKIDSGQVDIRKREFRLADLFNELYELYQNNFANKGIEFICKIDDNIENLIVFADDQKIYQILNNLLNNAFKFTNSGRVEYGYYLQDGKPIFYVQDTGVGIAKENIENIFQRFSQEDLSISRGYEGTGLGLSIAKGLIEAMGGNIKVQSEKGRGSRFEFGLELEIIMSKNETIDLETEFMSDEMESTNNPFGIKVLVAEDDQTNFLLLERSLTKEFNAEVIRAENGYQAIEAFKSTSGIDLIIMDIKMPELDGYEATKQIRIIDPDVPILAVTAYALIGDSDKAIAAGCNDYVAKPFDREKLMVKIAALIKR